MTTVKPEELHELVSKAVQQALKQRKVTEAELRQLLPGPIIIGMIPDPQQVATEIQKSPGAMAKPAVYEKPRLIGYVIGDLQHLESGLKSK